MYAYGSQCLSLTGVLRGHLDQLGNIRPRNKGLWTAAGHYEAVHGLVCDDRIHQFGHVLHDGNAQGVPSLGDIHHQDGVVFFFSSVIPSIMIFTSYDLCVFQAHGLVFKNTGIHRLGRLGHQRHKVHLIFATMSSDEFKNGKKILPFHLKRELNRELKAL